MGFDVLPYSIEALRNIFASTGKGPRHFLEDKHHLHCFANYMSETSVRTIVIESNYIDRDYLEDYASYYVRSFSHYDRTCHRLHFFSTIFTKQDFDDLLAGGDSILDPGILQDNYRGFMVLKPVPLKIIGRTCLITYEHQGRRYFPAIRKYPVTLFGINLNVHSIAFQEQDSVVAACASSAVWSAFHGTGLLFQHSLPSPVEITKAATIHFPFTNRHFPNKGLTPEQMAHAIRNVGLDPYLYNAGDYDETTSSIYGYLKGKIPVILGMGLYEETEKGFVRVGSHAVTVLGYSLGRETPSKFGNVCLTSSRIDRIYVHDDQVGPFARMEFDGRHIEELYVDGKTKRLTNGFSIPSISTTWKSKLSNRPNAIRASLEILLIPLYHKIRIPYKRILETVFQFDKTLQNLLDNSPIKEIEWDIYLTEVSRFKNDIFETATLESEEKKSILTRPMPKYLWRAEGRIHGKRIVDFIFDATDIEHGKSFIFSVNYSAAFCDLMKTIAPDIPISGIRVLNTRYIWEHYASLTKN